MSVSGTFGNASNGYTFVGNPSKPGVTVAKLPKGGTISGAVQAYDQDSNALFGTHKTYSWNQVLAVLKENNLTVAQANKLPAGFKFNINNSIA